MNIREKWKPVKLRRAAALGGWSDLARVATEFMVTSQVDSHLHTIYGIVFRSLRFYQPSVIDLAGFSDESLVHLLGWPTCFHANIDGKKTDIRPRVKHLGTQDPRKHCSCLSSFYSEKDKKLV